MDKKDLNRILDGIEPSEDLENKIKNAVQSYRKPAFWNHNRKQFAGLAACLVIVVALFTAFPFLNQGIGVKSEDHAESSIGTVSSAEQAAGAADRSQDGEAKEDSYTESGISEDRMYKSATPEMAASGQEAYDNGASPYSAGAYSYLGTVIELQTDGEGKPISCELILEGQADQPPLVLDLSRAVIQTKEGEPAVLKDGDAVTVVYQQEGELLQVTTVSILGTSE